MAGVADRFPLWTAPIPATLEIGPGQILLLEGWTTFPIGRGARYEVEIGSDRVSFPFRRDVELGVAGADRAERVAHAFWLPVPIGPERAGRTETVVAALASRRGRFVILDRQIAFDRRAEPPPLPRARVAVCMTTYEPDLELLRRQVESLRAQTVRDFVCLVQDDCSQPERYAEIERICLEDPRFRVVRNTVNLGFYRNFERCLSRVPAGIELVALCDQDDFWYPDKLEVTLARFRPGVAMVYSDMRLVDREGRVLAQTYWTTRRNNHRSLPTLLFANTVTGAASVIRWEVLDKALPFPPVVGSMFHDHWLAVVALVMGEIDYIDRPLYDYTQHGTNVIGHCGLERPPLGEALRDTATKIGAVLRRPSRIREPVYGKLAVHRYDYRRLAMLRHVLRLRFPDLPDETARALDLFSDRWRDVPALALAHLGVRARGDTTDMAEIRLASSLAFQKLLMPLVPTLLRTRSRLAGLRDRVLNRVRRVGALSPTLLHDLVLSERGRAMARRLVPLTMDVSPTAPRRVNLLVPEVAFQHLFGGYIGKFQLALRLRDEGFRVRIILVDETPFDLAACRAKIANFPGLEALFDRVEFVRAHPRERPIDFNPADRVVATTFWTAHIAHAAVAALEHKSFVYLIQEYEPFTFPMGAWSALAEQSYTFPHAALFSTALLEEFFQQRAIGVFSRDLPTQKFAHFENAIVQGRRLSTAAAAGRRRLLFYCRPEEHAARNMFELAICGLNRALEEGVFDDRWEFHGIGAARAGLLALSEGRTLRLIERLDYKHYVEFLGEYDVGLSLMHTPHPSLVPLEMASAGMLVVTNTCLNKTRERLAALSSNLIACEPTIEGVAQGLREAAGAVDDLERRTRGQEVRWATSWEEAFHPALLAQVAGWLGGAPAARAGSGRAAGEREPAR